jgi:hypothetical protein
MGCYRQVTPSFLDFSDPDRTMPTLEETLSLADNRVVIRVCERRGDWQHSRIHSGEIGIFGDRISETPIVACIGFLTGQLRFKPKNQEPNNHLLTFYL